MTFEAYLRVVKTEAAGVLRLYLVNRPAAADLLEQALDGDPEALRLIVAVRDSVNRISTAATRSRISPKMAAVIREIADGLRKRGFA